MNSTWAKIKLAFLLLLILMGAIFLIANRDTIIPINLIYKTYEPNMLLVLLCTCVFSIFGFWLFKVVWRSMRQLKTSRERSRTDKLEREMAEMKSKASMLQTKPEISTSKATEP